MGVRGSPNCKGCEKRAGLCRRQDELPLKKRGNSAGMLLKEKNRAGRETAFMPKN